MAAWPPRQIVSVASAVRVKPRSFCRTRIASFRSCSQRSMPSERRHRDDRCSFGGGAPVATASSCANDGQDGIWLRAVFQASSSLEPRSIRVVYRDSSSVASSSTISSKRSSGTSRRDRCWRTYPTKSRILESRRTLNSGHEHTPRFALLRQLLTAGCGELVEAASPLSGSFDPPARDAALRFEAIEDRIQRCDIEDDGTVGALLDARGDVVAVPRLILELREHQQFSRAFLEGVFVGGCAHIS